MHKPSSRLSRDSDNYLTRSDSRESLLQGRKQSGNLYLIIIILVAIMVIGSGIFVWSRKDSKNTEDKKKDTSQVETPTLAEKEEDVTETITEVDLLLQHYGDQELLPSETPATFIDYISTRLNDFDCDFSENSEAGFKISKISPRFVAGSIGCLGGAATAWYLTTAGWEELGYQSHVPCSKLEELAIPSDFLAECYDDTSEGEEVLPNPNGPLN